MKCKEKAIYDKLPTRIKECCDGTSGLKPEREQQIVEKFLSRESRLPTPPPPKPTLLTQAATLASAIIQHVRHGLPMVTDEVYKQRIGVCEACDKFNADKTCQICGCNMEIKARWGEQECPIGKWSADLPKQEGLGLCGCQQKT